MGITIKSVEIVIIISIILLIVAFIVGLLARYVSLRGDIGCEQTDTKKAEKCNSALSRVKNALLYTLIVLGGLIGFSLLMFALIIQDKSKARAVAAKPPPKPAPAPQSRKIKIVQKSVDMSSNTIPASQPKPVVQPTVQETMDVAPVQPVIPKRSPVTVPPELLEPVGQQSGLFDTPATKTSTAGTRRSDISPDNDNSNLQDVVMDPLSDGVEQN